MSISHQSLKKDTLIRMNALFRLNLKTQIDIQLRMPNNNFNILNYNNQPLQIIITIRIKHLPNPNLVKNNN